MNLYNQKLLVLLLIIPLLIWLAIKKKDLFKKRFLRFAEEQFFPLYFHSFSPFFTGIKLALLIASLLFVILALLRPQWDNERRDFDAMGMDIIFAIDVSRSMDATDMSPSRLTRAKMQMMAFVEKLQSDRVGIIAFAGRASLECPLTDDYESVLMIINGLSTNTISKLGTDIGAAMIKAGDAFARSGSSKILILISDGEDLEQHSISLASKLASQGITIYTMGVGSENGTIITHPITGAQAETKLDVDTLKKIAISGKGEFYAVTPGQVELKYLLDRIYAGERGHLYSRNLSSLKEQYHIFAIIALLLLCLESLINPIKKPAPPPSENF